jgi:phospholipase/carboxylesterase
VTRILEAKRKGAAPGQADAAVVLLHGYGANADDLLGLADLLAPHMPGTAFVAPDAPELCIGNPMGYQWFPIPWIDGSPQEAAERGMADAVGDLQRFLDALLAEEGLPAERVILFGFSQGTMMALHVAARRAVPFAGVVGFSGRLLLPELLQDEATSRPPVLLVHGDSDPVVPPASLPEAAEALQQAGFDVYAHIMKGTEHGIAPDGLSVALAFMRDRLGFEQSADAAEAPDRG